MEAKAFSVSDMQQWGCPKCGFRSGSSHFSAGGAASWQCGDCGAGTIILNDGLTRTPTQWVNPTGVLSKHPREGQPAHGRPDKPPPEGGEYFRSRGVGMDQVPTCFVCGKDVSGHYVPNIAAFAQCKEAGERLLAMFEGRARLDYREREPDRIQFKVGVCDEHKGHLEELDRRTSAIGDRIDKETLAAVIRGEKEAP